MSRRRDNVSWSVHSEVAPLEPDEQNRFLAPRRGEEPHTKGPSIGPLPLPNAYPFPPALPAAVADALGNEILTANWRDRLEGDEPALREDRTGPDRASKQQDHESEDDTTEHGHFLLFT